MKCKDATIEFLDSLPRREWCDTDHKYDSILMYPSNHLHDSEWNAITLVGCMESTPVHIITSSSDDISAIFKSTLYQCWETADVHIDCCPVSKAFHIWSRTVKFKVSDALSSINITTVPR